MKNIVLFIILLLSVNFSFAQTIYVNVENLNDNKAVLSSLSGEKISFVDSVSAINKKEFNFSLDNRQSGIYRLAFNSKTWLDFIYDNEDIEIKTDANNIIDSLKVVHSESNKIYCEFIKLNKEYKTKSELLQMDFLNFR